MQDLLGPLILFALAMCLTPGPNVVMLTATAVNFGFRRAIPPALGVTFGFGLTVVAAGAGLLGLFEAEPRLHTALKYAGGAYLLYLAWRIAQADPGRSGSLRAKPISFVGAVLFTWVNPKGWVTAVGALAAFTTAGGDRLPQIAVIAAVLTGACLLSAMLWAAFGAAVAGFLGNRAPARPSTGRWPASSWPRSCLSFGSWASGRGRLTGPPGHGRERPTVEWVSACRISGSRT